MSGGPFRVQQQTDRRVPVNRPEQVRRPAEERAVETPNVTPRVATHTAKSSTSAKRKRPMWQWIIGLFILLAIVGCFIWMNIQQAAGIVVDKSKYQAVFFTNGQVYFGKLSSANKDYLKLTDIFYLQATGDESANPQRAGKSSDGMQLIKLGDEIHGPEDEMIISREQVLFYENLKTDSKVSETIKSYKK